MLSAHESAKRKKVFKIVLNQELKNLLLDPYWEKGNTSYNRDNRNKSTCYKEQANYPLIEKTSSRPGLDASKAELIKLRPFADFSKRNMFKCPRFNIVEGIGY